MRPPGRRRLAALAFALVGLASARAGAEAARRPARFALDVVTPGPLDACGGGDALAARVTARLRRDALSRADEADVVIGVEVDPAGAAHITERARDGAALGSRDVTLGEPGCEKALDTLAVVLAIMIGPERLVDVPASPPPPRPVPPPREAPSPPPPPPPSRSARLRFDEEPPLALHVSPLVEASLGTGVLPHVSGGLGVGMVVFPPLARVSVLARVAYWPARSTETAAAATVDRLGGSLAGCHAFLRLSPSTAVAGCLGFEAGRLHSRSSALTRPSETAPYMDVFAEGRLGHRFAVGPHVVLEPLLAVQVAAVLRRDRFTYRDRVGAELTLLQPSPVAFATTFGLGVHFL